MLFESLLGNSENFCPPTQPREGPEEEGRKGFLSLIKGRA